MCAISHRCHAIGHRDQGGVHTHLDIPDIQGRILETLLSHRRRKIAHAFQSLRIASR